MIKGGINALKFFFLSCLLMGCALAVFLTTDTGKAQLINVALKYINHQDVRVSIQDIESYFPLNMTFSKIKIRDKGATVLSLKNVKVQIDPTALFFDKQVAGKINVETCDVFKAPGHEESSISPLDLGVDLDLDLSCGKVSMDDVTASMPQVKIQYDHAHDMLKYDGKVAFDLSGQHVFLDLGGQGPLNDFSLAYKIQSDKLSFHDVGISQLKGEGGISHLPWKSTGPLDLAFTHENSPGHLKAVLSQEGDLIHCHDVSLKIKGAELVADVSYDIRLGAVKGKVEAELNQSRPSEDMPLSGVLKLDSNFEFKNGDVNLILNAKGRDLKAYDYAVQSLECAANAQNILLNPVGSITLKTGRIEGLLDSLLCDGIFKNGVGEIALHVKGNETYGDVSLNLKHQKDVITIGCNGFDAHVAGVPIKLEKSFEATIQGLSFKMTPAQLVIMNSPLTIAGDVKNGQLNFTTKGQLDILTFSRLLLQEDDIAVGKLSVDMKVSGPWYKITLDGDAEVKSGSYENIIYGTAFKDIHIKLKADNKAISIVTATAKDAEKGTVTATGNLQFADLLFEVNLLGKQVRIISNDTMSLVARSADVTLKGTPSKAAVSGIVVADEGHYAIKPQVKSARHDMNVLNPVPRKKLDICEVRKKTDDVVVFNPALDLNLKFPPVLKINGRGLTSVWKGDLELKGSYEDTVVGGQLEVDIGQINFLGQTVKLEKGTITFDGASDNIPYIDTTGTLERKDIEVTVGVIGRVNKPTIDLQSAPALPKDEILSILFFGKDKSTLSPLEGVQLARALAAYKGIGPNLDFFGMITDNLGLDQFAIGTGTTDGTYTVKLSKRLGDKIRVNLNQGMKPEDSKVELEVDVTKNISVVGEHGFAGSADGVSLNYNWDY